MRREDKDLELQKFTRGYSSTTLSPSPLPLTKRLSIVLFGRVSERVAAGFTLAETLITLVIIGVVAALTVPTMIAKYQKEQTVTRLKKAYSALAQTTARAVADNGPIETWEYNNISEFIEKYLLPYLSIGYNCKFDSTTSKCDYSSSYLNNRNSKNKSNGYKFYLADGTLIIADISISQSRKYVDINIDINGTNKPNILGRDKFIYRYELFVNDAYRNRIGRIMPPDFDISSRNTILSSQFGCNTNGNGAYCSNLIMLDGWQIKDDYPW